MCTSLRVSRSVPGTTSVQTSRNPARRKKKKRTLKSRKEKCIRHTTQNGGNAFATRVVADGSLHSRRKRLLLNGDPASQSQEFLTNHETCQIQRKKKRKVLSLADDNEAAVVTIF
jgi:hypothetical protein